MPRTRNRKVLRRPSKPRVAVVRCTSQELDFFTRCTRHAAFDRSGGVDDPFSGMVRHLFTVYATEHGIPFNPNAAPALTAKELFARLGIEGSSPAAYVPRDVTCLDDNIDPDRFDERNGGFFV